MNCIRMKMKNYLSKCINIMSALDTHNINNNNMILIQPLVGFSSE